MKRAVEVLEKCRTHPEFYHPMTKRQFEVIWAYKYVGWNAGMVKGKPWFQMVRKDADGDLYLMTYFSTKFVENFTAKDVDEFCEKHGIYHKTGKFKVRHFVGGKKDWNFKYTIRDEGTNGFFHCILLRYPQDEGDEPSVKVDLEPIDSLVKYNKSHEKEWLGAPKDGRITIHKEMPKSVSEDLITLRVDTAKFQQMTGRQWVDLNNSKYYKVIENEPDSDGALPFDYRELRVGGYDADQLSRGLKNAQEAHDEEAVKLIGQMNQIYYDKLRSVRPVITVKKILGWNAGFMMDKPWFATCWQDKLGRVMMDVLLSVEKLDNPSNEEIDRICEDNGIFHKMQNFVSVKPYQNRTRFTYYMDKYSEGNEKIFYRVVLMMKESMRGPKVVDAEFCSVESLNKFNETTHVVNARTFRRIVEKKRLDNATLKAIPAEDIRMFYYNQGKMSREFVIVTEKKPVRRNGGLVEVGKNILAKSVDYVWHTGTYGTSELLPDNLNAKLGVVLDDFGLREKYGNANATFALDDLTGWAEVNGWIAVNNETEHLIFREDYRKILLDTLDYKIVLPERMMRSNTDSDLGACWKKIIEKCFRMKEGSLKCERMKEFPAGVTAGKVVAFTFATSEAREWPGLCEIVTTSDGGKVKGFAVECMGRRNAKNMKRVKSLFPFLDSERMAIVRDSQNEEVLTGGEKFISAFDMLRGGFDFAILGAEWRWYDIGFGRHLFVPLKYAREIFSRERVRQFIKEEKLSQIAERNRQELYYLILAQWVRFFDEVV